ncbi:LamG-like jellyroll fold domain-containing protein [Porphyromonas levii]|uniref:LamG-like jellyroll fold domain-containing protein n=1 Tax=Porphyromonas levii TaxID=28114 RepID=UPI001B8BCC93|nr:LamG-like jellyroll fold domain-containing protein [Porphyromonas levii]MBR8713386.1 hypothetical protein [Porphyromonas levii]MBR8715421.1 hypothetical protein [Porphyromonas levii]MBR8727928.1 hypothetical protein [Porphyromonas levii]MBR8736291.1 hypothetical protein [Porphyromonas levii]MBR8778294.1 hypothetical protein [Porphyromonas levii]
MKRIIFLSLSLLSMCFVAACTHLADGTGDSPYLDKEQGTDNGAYMENIDKTGYVEAYVPTGKGGFATITPRIAAPIDKDVTIKVIADPTVVASNPTAVNIKAKGIPAKDVVFIGQDGAEHKGEITVTIPKGSVAAPIKCGVSELNPDNYPFRDKWAVGVRIISVDGSVPLLSEPLSTVIKFNREVRVVTSVAEVTLGGWGLNILTNEPFTKEWDEWTIQMSVVFRYLSHNNISTGWFLDAAPGSSMYTRIHSTKGIQIKSLHEREDSWTNKPLNTNEWINISYVYTRDGGAGKMKVYVDDELQNELVTTPISFAVNSTNTGWSIGNSNWKQNYLREVRIWNKALSQAEIKENLELPMELDTDGLVMYMPCTKEYFDEETGLPKVAKGNWRVEKPKKEGDRTKFNFIDNVVFPNKKVVIEKPETSN